MKFRSKAFGMLVAGALTAALSVAGGGVAQATQGTTTPATAFAGVFHPIKNVGNGLCLQPDAPVVSAGVVQERCDANNPAQGWESQQVATNHYRFINQQSGLCFAVFIGAGEGNPIGLQTCRPVSGEEFNTNSSLPNIVILESRSGFRDTGFCVDAGNIPVLGQQMVLSRCNGFPSQRWVVGFD